MAGFKRDNCAPASAGRRRLLQSSVMALSAITLSGWARADGVRPELGNAAANRTSTQARNGDATKSSVAANKVSQADAKYQTSPKGDQKCSSCAQFQADSSQCKVVEGTVSPSGWCSLFVSNNA